MIKKISTETISAIKDGAVVSLAANAEIKMIGKSVVLTIDDKNYEWDEDEVNLIDFCVKLINMLITHHNIQKLYEIISTIFTEKDNDRTFEFGDFTLGLTETEDDAMWWEKGIYVIPTNAKDEDGEWDYSLATYYTLEPFFNSLLKDITDNMADTIFRDMETAVVE